VNVHIPKTLDVWTGLERVALNLHGRSPLSLALTAGAAEGAQALTDLGAFDKGPAKRKKKLEPE